MLRSTWLLILCAGLAPACTIPPSQSLGAGESSSSGDDPSSSGNVDPTTDPSSCPPSNAFTCTSPYDGVSFGACGGLDFDENCCMRPTCDSAADCGTDEVCAAVGSPGLACVEEDGACVCASNLGPFPRPVCLPVDAVPTDWCGGHADETACNAAAPEQPPQFCRWIELYTMSIDGDACNISEPEGRCLTIDYNPEEGCGPEPCATTDHGLQLTTAIARDIDGGTTFEVFGLTDVFCGGGRPAGDWIPASDASLGACALTCGFDNPCAVPFEEWVALRAAATEDAGVDCGNLTLDDPLADWQAAHDCAVQQATSGAGFHVIHEAQAIDSVPRYAFVGLQAESYAVVGLHADEGFGDYALYEQVGDGLSDVDGCTVAVGELCLATANAGPTEQLCPQ
ncbi:MAG TPA: hypothetical protein VG755_40445 [Nannocystaceae bacterium]|nr:hypothetical protein [Nannocystaceae bacterium]